MTSRAYPGPWSAIEWHSGVITGRSNRPDLPRPDWSSTSGARAHHPRQALDELVLAALAGERPVAVQFSGGRDSSLLLAVAVDLARRKGLTPPRAIALRYPGAPLTEESVWQDLVGGHLGVEVEVVEIPPGGDDVSGPLGVAAVRRFGPLMPPTAGINALRLSQVASGHTVLTGEGGDDVLGHQRVSWFVAHWRARVRPRAAARRAMAFELLPSPVRRQRLERHLAEDLQLSWLLPETRSRVLRDLAEDQVAEPWDWRDATWDFLSSRASLNIEDLDGAARAVDVHLVHPLLDPSFVEALCRFAGRSGLDDRTAAMRLLAGDLLPTAVLGRATKAEFTGVYAGEWTRSFALAWNGGGVDPNLVDIEALRQTWSAGRVHALSLSALQLALASMIESGWTASETGA